MLLKLSNYSFILSLVLFFLMVTPLVRLRLSHSQVGFFAWLLKVFGLQFVLTALFISFVFAFMGQGPAFVMGKLDLAQALDNLSEYYSKWGLFPWSGILFWAVFLGYFTYIKKGVPHIYHCCNAFVPRFMNPVIKGAADSLLSSISTMALASVMASGILLLVYFVESFVPLNHVLIPSVTGVFFSIILPLFLLKWGRKKLISLFANGLTLNQFYILTGGLLLILALIAGFFNVMIFSAAPDLVNLSELSYVHKLLPDAPVRFTALFWAWWLLVIPLAGSWLASISKGRTFGQLIFGFLILPVLVYVSSLIFGRFFWFHVLNQLLHIPQREMLLLLSIFCMGVIWFVTKGHQSNALFIRGLIPLEEHHNQGRYWLHQASKTQGLGKFSIGLIFSVASFLMLHSVGGWYTVQVQILAIGVSTMILLYESLIIFTGYLLADKILIKNQNIRSLKGAFTS